MFYIYIYICKAIFLSIDLSVYIYMWLSLQTEVLERGLGLIEGMFRVDPFGLLLKNLL